MNIEICVVDVDAASYSQQALYAADAQFPGGAWKAFGHQEGTPAGSTVMRTHRISLAYGLPNWAYCFWREVD
jgi:hypothetical protein